MATTTELIDFIPSRILAPKFQVTLDSEFFTVTCEWSLAAQRYYIKIASLDGAVVLYTALVGSPIGINISSASWANGTATITLTSPHFLTVGKIVNRTIKGMVPDAYNGQVRVMATNRNTLTYAITTDPGAATVLGVVQANIDLLVGQFDSTLVYRAANAQFEITSQVQ